MSLVQMICDDRQVKSLRYRYFWFFGGLCLVGVVLYTTLMPASTLPVLLVNDKTAHGIAFVALMTWFCGVFEMRFSPLVAIALVCLGVLIELLQQQLSYRSAELADSLADFAGIGVGWALAAAGLQHWAAVLESWFVPNQS